MNREAAIKISEYARLVMSETSKLLNDVEKDFPASERDDIRRQLGAVIFELRPIVLPTWKEYPDLEPQELIADRAKNNYSTVLSTNSAASSI